MSPSWTLPLIPAVKRRQVAGVPPRAQPGRAQVPVGADLTRDLPQVAPQIGGRRPAPEPVAVVDAVDHEAGPEHESVGDHGIVFGIGVLLDVQILLYRAP